MRLGGGDREAGEVVSLAETLQGLGFLLVAGEKGEEEEEEVSLKLLTSEAEDMVGNEPWTFLPLYTSPTYHLLLYMNMIYPPKGPS